MHFGEGKWHRIEEWKCANRGQSFMNGEKTVCILKVLDSRWMRWWSFMCTCLRGYRRYSNLKGALDLTGFCGLWRYSNPKSALDLTRYCGLWRYSNPWCIGFDEILRTLEGTVTPRGTEFEEILRRYSNPQGCIRFDGILRRYSDLEILRTLKGTVSLTMRDCEIQRLR